MLPVILPARPVRRNLLVVSRRGLTLVEILITLTIMAVLTGGVIAGVGGTRSTRLRHGTTLIASAVRAGYARANATSKSLRLVMDFSERALWLEEADRPMLVQSKDLNGGAAAATDIERRAHEEAELIIKGPQAPRAQFKQLEGAKKKVLPNDIVFRSVQTGHDEEARTDGRAYLYFWPGGRTERASIQLGAKDSTSADSGNTVLVAPLTGRANVVAGAVPLEPISEEKGDREESPQ